MTKRIGLYLRTSTDEQTTANQLAELTTVAERHHDWRIVAVFDDAGISGAMPRQDRPAMQRLLRAVTRREIDLVAAWSVDRLGRSLTDLLGFLGELHDKKVGLYLHLQGVDTSTAAGKAMFQLMGVFAEFERAMIRERVKAGMIRAQASGTRSGKAIGRPAVNAAKALQAREMIAEGQSARRTAEMTGLSRRTVARLASSKGAAS